LFVCFKPFSQCTISERQLFNIIGHDLRSPFKGILGLTEVLLESHAEIDDEKREELIAYIAKSTKGVYNLVENLLEWASTQTGRLEYLPKTLVAAEVLNETLFDIKSAVDNKNIRVVDEGPSNWLVYADRNMLKTVFRNLISNAVKFTNEGGTVTVKATKTEHEIRFSVEDIGVGMRDEILSNLFNINQTTTPGTNNEMGTGLGLMLCKEFIDLHGGKIWVESEEGKGGRFIFTLPAKEL